MAKVSSVVIGKVARHIARLRGGGSALPGLIIEKIDHNFVSDCLGGLPHGVVVISGTNGKTTTTKIVVELLEKQGLKVFTNRTGSNFVRGVIAALLENVNLHGQLDADIAVLELDEAHAVRFIETITPTYCLLLNVMRDQLDRFGEIDHTADLLAKLATKTTNTVVINREDRRLAKIKTPAKITYFGLSDELKVHFPEDDELLDKNRKKVLASKLPANVVLTNTTNQMAVFTINEKTYSTTLDLKGVYNVFNAAAALSLVTTILPDANTISLISDLSTIKSAFGRGESFTVSGQPLELLLVKNPSGFQLALESFSSGDYANMISINDNYADGRDMSWLWNVDFSSLQQVNMVSGIRAYDMALRLKYDVVDFTTSQPDISKALHDFLQLKQPKRIFATYTAMLEIRKLLAKYTDVERVL
ncbi:MurT ligase domain-containing protein [Candidatus Saccharibacteria bacterium]|nr:MurT ligase domain-containing protein [Candidatus Saccharibacteria bacterium]